MLTKATPEGTLTYTYDAHGNVLTIDSSNTNGASLTYTYDALNNVAYGYDDDHCVKSEAITADAAGEQQLVLIWFKPRLELLFASSTSLQ